MKHVVFASCPSDHWEFAAGGASVRIANTGNVAIAYIARPDWQLGAHYVRHRDG